MDDILSYRPIGLVRTPYGRRIDAPHQATVVMGTEAEAPAEAVLELRADLPQEMLEDLEGFERIWLIYWMDRVEAFRPKVVPYRDIQERGLFATRSPTRPNPIGMSVVRLLRREGNILHVADIDTLDGTPLLDIKPYVPEFDAHPGSRAGWLDAPAMDRRHADDRFHAETPGKRSEK